MIEVIQKYYGRWVVTKFVKEHNHAVLPPSRVRYVAPEEYADLEPFIGMEFPTHEDAQTFYYAYASRVGFDVRIRLSRRSTRDESFVMRRFVCTKEGFTPYEENFDDGGGGGGGGKRRRNRTPTREGCKAMFEVIKKDYERWIVSKLVLEHTHELAVAPSRVHYIQSQSEVVVLAKSGGGGTPRETASALNSLAPQIGEPGRGGLDHHHHHPTGGEQDARNDTREAAGQSSFVIGVEETQSLLDYFKRLQDENPAFFYAFQVDKNDCLISVFWADAKARMSYYCFGDAVTFDSSFLGNKSMLPFVTFTGVNHHLQSVIFGSALLTCDSEASFVWVFENWLLAMCSRPPVSLVTDHSEVIGAAAAKVFPSTRHRINKWSILSRTRENLSNIYSKHATFQAEFESCVLASETVEAFESDWSSILDRYGLRENLWLQSVYGFRHQWVSVYTKDAFSAEISATRRPESLSRFYEKYFNTKTSLLVFVSLFEQAVSCWYENEALEDFANMYTKPVLKTPSLLLKQAAEFYTRTIFDVFQDEFIESLGYHVDRVEDGEVCKYSVAKDEDARTTCVVTYASSEKKASCSCCKFEVSGILCRHILRVLPIVGVCALSEEYILKRWTKNAKNGFVLDECVRYNDICRDATKYAKEGSSSMEVYKVAKEALQMAFGEVVAAKKSIGCTM
ncbi:unnamed protein product [Spirodela intermedia]|uniref:Protein FAR1-RELATED SEQUENCE n=1 Tax=Spirodela intermedia TaxID=51605 RepID=A0A7I8L8Q9_SPIIN|nr:unnamed protein product [Spirodela intermedia]